MKFLIHLILWGVLLGLPSFAGAISRIGGGKVGSQFSLFDADLSLQYQKLQTGNEMIHLYTLPSVIGRMGGYSYGKIFLSEFKDIFPDFITFNREDLVHEYTQRGFDHIRRRFNLPSCVEIFYKESDFTNQYVLTWGNGRGFQINLTYDPQTQQEGQHLIQSVALAPKACAWN